MSGWTMCGASEQEPALGEGFPDQLEVALRR